MKNLISILALITISIVLNSCGNSAPDNSEVELSDTVSVVPSYFFIGEIKQDSTGFDIAFNIEGESIKVPYTPKEKKDYEYVKKIHSSLSSLSITDFKLLYVGDKLESIRTIHVWKDNKYNKNWASTYIEPMILWQE
jgi:hypothetical protein